MQVNQQAVNKTMAQFDKHGVHVYFCKNSGGFVCRKDNGLFAKSIGYDSIEELLNEMNATYRALCGSKYTIETTLNTSTEVSLYLAKIGMKNSRVFINGEEVEKSLFRGNED